LLNFLLHIPMFSSNLGPRIIRVLYLYLILYLVFKGGKSTLCYACCRSCLTSIC
jgi:hypothetical protein